MLKLREDLKMAESSPVDEKSAEMDTAKESAVLANHQPQADTTKTKKAIRGYGSEELATRDNEAKVKYRDKSIPLQRYLAGMEDGF